MFLSACFTPRKGPIKAYSRAAALKPFDAIIVPGVPFKNGAWDSIMKARVLWSYILYKEGYAKNIIYSGSAVYSSYREAVIMGLYAQELGIPKAHIFYDCKARHSTENVYYSYLIALEQGFKTIALATDPFQALMLRSFTRKRFGTKIYHLPFITDSVKLYAHLQPRIDPSSAKVDSFVSITDQESFFRRMRGTMGKDIDFKQYKNGQLPPL